MPILFARDPKCCKGILDREIKSLSTNIKPNHTPPFKCYLYCKSDDENFLNSQNSIKFHLENHDVLGGRGPGLYRRLNNSVVCEFICNGVREFDEDTFALDIIEPKFIENYVTLNNFVLDNPNKNKILSVPLDWVYVLEKN